MPGALGAAAQLFKDHPIILIAGMFISSWIATATLTWAVSEHLRVAPMRAELEAQTRAKRSSPVIHGNVLLTEKVRGEALGIQQTIRFSDPEGDAVFVNYVVLRTNAKRLFMTSASIDIPREDQIRGAAATPVWTCDGSTYFVELRAIITDAAGNASLPKDYRIDCYDWRGARSPGKSD